MTALAALVALGYAVVNAFGAWSVVRRRSAIAALFLAAAASLTIGAVAAGFGSAAATPFVAVGAVAASAASWWNARSVLRRVVAQRHLVRASAGVLATLLAFLATRWPA